MTRREYREFTAKARKINDRANRAKKSNFKRLKTVRNEYTNRRVDLTMMTAKNGQIIYAVIVRRLNNGTRVNLFTKDNIRSAWNIFKGAAYAA